VSFLYCYFLITECELSHALCVVLVFTTPPGLEGRRTTGG
jgi:hypothetical protein